MMMMMMTISCADKLCACRRFQPVTVPEPTVDETYEILLGLRERYEAHHKLRYTDESLRAASKYSAQYISDRFLPDKACLPLVTLYQLHLHWHSDSSGLQRSTPPRGTCTQ